VVEDGCELAVRRGLSGVIVPPQLVPLAGLHLAGTPVGLVTLVGWHDGMVEPSSGTVLCAQGIRLVADGATDVAVLADRGRLEADGGRRFARDVRALVEVVQARGARVRVVLDTAGQTPAATAAACELLGTTGAWLVQGGAWRGGRTNLSRLQVMRAALPDEVRLKWAVPVRTLDSMMIGIAEGLDLFEGDSGSLLEDAEQRASLCRLVVPARGLDY
jgi:deoxyribose-phosphate aldolase